MALNQKPSRRETACDICRRAYISKQPCEPTTRCAMCGSIGHQARHCHMPPLIHIMDGRSNGQIGFNQMLSLAQAPCTECRQGDTNEKAGEAVKCSICDRLEHQPGYHYVLPFSEIADGRSNRQIGLDQITNLARIQGKKYRQENANKKPCEPTASCPRCGTTGHDRSHCRTQSSRIEEKAKERD